MHHDGHAPVIAHVRVRLGILFRDLIFVDRQSTTKTAKIGSLENFWPYGMLLGFTLY